MKTSTKTWIAGVTAVVVLGAGGIYYMNQQQSAQVTLQETKQISKMSNTEKAVALLKSFETGDTGIAKQVLKKDYIQHNQTVATGLDGFLQIMEGAKNGGSAATVDIKRQFEDGNTVVLHSVYNFGGQEMVGFDVFKFDDAGMITEHWDNLSPVRDANYSGHTQFDGAATIDTSVNGEETKKLVSTYIDDIIYGQHPEKLDSYFDGDHYIQHNADMVDTVSGFKASLQQMAQMGINMDYKTTHQVLAQGDFALVISEGNLAGKETAFYDLYRVENGKIAEHWDVLADVIADSEAANTNGKF
ncbi:hypothetical protein STRDD10_01984 [Streptococcus sp. DD10]|uniref:nuclear transport factor 2 family protein n=1 Tax=Streptococcus sp. DD10 TaxID=1777878 RepID=UPI00079CC3E4|nr:nuclear transport factor 2 family protein [Streptococcus sp. DD10]KXT72337.1 hypothetical protein STRDD10_01984 [Streptococcus sp. DD10]